MSVGPKHALEFPDGFDDFAWETESKGWLSGVIAIVDGRRYQVTFYDPIRLAQDIETELERSALFFERNVLVVRRVDRAHMEAAVAALVGANRHLELSSMDVKLDDNGSV